jgi:biotin carboxyl carrier protein
MTGNAGKYKVLVNGFEFFLAKDELANLDLISLGERKYNLIKDNRSINAKITSPGTSYNKMDVEINGRTFNIEIKDELAQQLEKMGFGASSARQIKEIKAPMPGLVLEIAVTEGQKVKEGDKILILEAMKMENSLIIHSNATIKKINAKIGQAVEKGQLLVELE